jgi:prevent-host-death family protein
MQHVTLDDAKKHLGDLIEAAVNGDEVVITKGDRPVVKLVPVGATNAQPRFGSAKGLITMSDDFDAPLEDFGEYMK